MNSYSSLHAFSNLVDTFLYCGDWGGQIGTALFSLVPRLLRSYLHSSLGMRLNIGYTTTTKRFSTYTLRGRSSSSVSAKPLSGSGITGLYHSNVVYG